MRPEAWLGLALLLGSGCAVIVGIEDHYLATTSSGTTSAAGGTGGAGGTATGTGGGPIGNCPPPDLGTTPCPAGFADCDSDGTCDSILASDEQHCGACNHDCLGGLCQGSVCKEVPLTPAYSPAEAFGPMTIHNGVLYFAAGPHEANMVFSVPVDGSAGPKIVSTKAVGEVYHLAVYADAQAGFLFVTAHDAGQWIVHGMLATGGTPNDIAPLSSFSTGLAVDGAGAVFVAEKSHILRITFSANEIVVSPDPIHSMVIDGAYVYWTSYPDTGTGLGKISRATLTGNGVTEIAAGLGRPTGLALDDGNVYWADMELGTVSRASKGGGAVETLVTGQPSPRSVAILGDDLFWSAADGLYRTRVCALAAAPLRLTANPVGAIAVDAKRVAATDLSFHQAIAFAR